MAATFPSSPTNGQTAEVGGRFYTWNSTTEVWENTGAASTLVSTANLVVSGTTTTTTANVGNITVNGTTTTATANVGNVNVTGTTTTATANVGNITVNGTTTTATANVGNVNVTGTISAGHTNPSTNNTYDLGTSSLRWRNIYTNDLNLSNGIGDYTIVEGEEDLFLYNNKNGKTYKFLIQEVDPLTAPPKSEK
jgi:hypothetical protein